MLSTRFSSLREGHSGGPQLPAMTGVSWQDLPVGFRPVELIPAGHETTVTLIFPCLGSLSVNRGQATLPAGITIVLLAHNICLAAFLAITFLHIVEHRQNRAREKIRQVAVWWFSQAVFQTVASRASADGKRIGNQPQAHGLFDGFR